MPTNENAQLLALAQIARIARGAYEGAAVDVSGEVRSLAVGTGTGSCRIKSLPERLHLDAARHAARINPVNAPLRAPLASGGPVLSPEHLTLLTSKYWGPSPRQFTVSFMEDTPADLQDRIVSHMNAWSDMTSMSFVRTNGGGEVRVSREAGGYWSYLGTDISLVPQDHQTMNLEGFTMGTQESEYHRVVRHETGHTLGFPHEHMRKELVARIDPEKAYAYFRNTQGWSREQVDQQVLTPLDDASIMGTPADQDSIMCYQLPGEITVDGEPIHGGLDINATDRDFAAQIYPKNGALGPSSGVTQDDWDPAKDVVLSS